MHHLDCSRAKLVSVFCQQETRQDLGSKAFSVPVKTHMKGGETLSCSSKGWRLCMTGFHNKSSTCDASRPCQAKDGWSAASAAQAVFFIGGQIGLQVLFICRLYDVWRPQPAVNKLDDCWCRVGKGRRRNHTMCDAEKLRGRTRHFIHGTNVQCWLESP